MAQAAAWSRRRVVALVTGHPALAALVAVGLVLRVLAWLAYRPALIYTDSYYYLDNLGPLDPGQLDPIGYPLLVLKPLIPLGGLPLVVIVQHLAGIGMGLALYALVLRWSGRRWLAAVAAAPVLVDAYQVQIEQNILSDVWLEVLLAVALWLLIGRGAPNARRAALAGLVLGAALLVRMVAIALIVPAVVYVALAGTMWRKPGGWRRMATRTAALLGCFAVVVAGYAGYFHAKVGYWGLNTASGNSLYGRTAALADCAKLDLDPVLAQLCPAQPLDQRFGPDYYAHMDGDPAWPGNVPPGETKYDLERQFAKRVIERQPIAVAGTVLRDFAKGFSPFRNNSANDPVVDWWQFQTSYPYFPVHPPAPPAQATQQQSEQDTVAATTLYGGGPPRANSALATVLRAYQTHGGYTPGPLLALGGVLGLLGGLNRRRQGRGGIRAAAVLGTAMALTVLGTAAGFEFSWRYQLPGLVLLPLAGALGLNVLLDRSTRTGRARSRRRLLASFPDDVDQAAMADFSARYGAPSFAPVLVVIAAYNEEGGISVVLDRLPSVCRGVPVDVLVVADGCSDDTARLASEHGAYTCATPVNRGQGAALRLGYHLAALGGARYVITTDADGQYDPDEMPLLLEPLITGEADFVTGSRRLGADGTHDRVRWLGVRLFAALATVLTARKLTDTSFGFRAMRTDLACAVRLSQPQYQASELLLSVLAIGARVVEKPLTMRVRTAGTTKKGGNFTYGRRYAWVMIRTWLREYPGRLLPATRRRRAGWLVAKAARRADCLTPSSAMTK